MNANVGLTDAADPADPNQHTDVDLNSRNYTYQNESNQSLSNAMATVGEGNVTVGGEEAELAGLNRDAENTTNEIYDVDRQQGNIDLTIDHRLLSEEGRQQITENFIDSYEFGEDIVRAANTLNDDDALGLLNFWEALHNNAQATQLKNDLLRNPDNADILKGLMSGDGDQYVAAMQELGALAQDKFGLELSDINFYDGDTTSSESLMNTLFTDVKGGVVNDESSLHHGDIFIDAGEGASKTDLVNTLGHETIELQTLQNGETQDASQEALANAFGNQFADRVNQATGGELDATGGSSFNQSLQGSHSVQNGTQLANEVGSANVEHDKRCQFAGICSGYDVLQANAIDLMGSENPEDQAEAQRILSVMEEYREIRAADTAEFLQKIEEDGVIDTFKDAIADSVSNIIAIAKNPELLEKALEQYQADLSGENGQARQLAAIDSFQENIAITAISAPIGGGVVSSVRVASKVADVDTSSANNLDMNGESDFGNIENTDQSSTVLTQPYSPNKVRADLEDTYGKENVKSKTNP